MTDVNTTSQADSAPHFSRAQRRSGPVPFATKFFQGLGSLPGQHEDFAFQTLLLLYYSQILGLPASYASAVLAIALIVDAISNPMIGAWSDGFRSRLGRRHPFMLAAIVPTALFMFLLFRPPVGLSVHGLTAWMLVTTVLVRCAMGFFVVPWNAVAAELSEDYRERTSIITYRMVLGWSIGVAFIFSTYSFIFPASKAFPNGLMNRDNYATFAIVISSLILIWMFTTAWMTRNQIPYLPQPTDAAPRQSFMDMARRTLTALTNRNFRLLFISTLFIAAVAGGNQVFDVYMNLYFWEFGPGDLRWFALAVVGAVGSFLTVGLLQKHFEKQKIMAGSVFALMVLGMIKVILRFTGVWPDNGDPLLLTLLVIHTSFGAYFYATVLIMFASMVADIVDEQDHNTGLRQEGVFSAGISFAGKATSGLGLVIGGVLLDLVVHFPRSAKPGQVPDHTLLSLAVIDGIIMPALYLVPLFLLLRYSLTSERLAGIQVDLQRRGQPQTETP